MLETPWERARESGERADNRNSNEDTRASLGDTFEYALPTIALPKGGGAIRGVGEKFASNPATGTGSVSIPILTSPGRGGMGPSLGLQYNSGAGNGLFGIGWSLAPGAITRKTERGIPQYRDAEESDVFLLGGAEDLVPVRNADGSLWFDDVDGHRLHRYRPRIDGSFARIERWTRIADGDTHWRVTTAGNVTSVYGLNGDTRIADPAALSRVFSWLLCQTTDDKGNAMVFEYAGENSRTVDTTQLCERNRSDATREVNRYLKRIKYGNRESLLTHPDLAAAQWLFEVVFDYDEAHWRETAALDDHGMGRVEASIEAGGAWAARPDPYSLHRAGFEVRCYRRCRRVLMFHRFAELGALPCLVASTEFDYNDIDVAASPATRDELEHAGSTRFMSQLQSVTHAFYRRRDEAPVMRDGVAYQTYDMQVLPRVEFGYTRAQIREEIEDVGEDDVRNLPAGFDDLTYRWLDLEGEGLPGILTEQGGAWFYKANRSPLAEDGGTVVASFAPLRHVAQLPQPPGLRGARQWLDLDRDGALNLTEFSGPTPGFFERTADESWQLHTPFTRLPNIDWQDPNLRLIDLTGDGLPDVLITESDVIVWYEGEGEAGFAAARRVHQALDEEVGPRVLLADGTQTIFLADMSGDGLTDLVRVRHAEVCYWPNLGYGRFGAKVTFDNPPLFDSGDQFDPRRIRLADITGSGAVDIVYLRRTAAIIHFNQSGNRLSDAYTLAFPAVDDTAHVAVVDLFGNGTACLTWNSPLAANVHAPMRYVRLMEEKPYLLTRTLNNMGGETRVRYAPSTRFYLQDQRSGRPWITKLPFPVHVVERVETFDAISRNRFASRYAYHHGYFDGVEREFRGFAMVEQWDTESYEDYVAGVTAVDGDQELGPQFYQPPVLTRTWFHTGAYFEEHSMQARLRAEYFGGQALLPESLRPPDVDADEYRECLRALKGATLRREIYSYDGSAVEDLPYQVSESRYEVQLLQHRGAGQHAAFMRVEREVIAAYYERNLDDPRIVHQFNLEFGPYGNVTKSAAVVHGRQTADATLPATVRAEQARLWITYSETDYTGDIDSAAPRAYRVRVPYESRGYEITGVAPTGALFELQELGDAIATTAPIDYDDTADGSPQRRLLDQTRGLFRDNALNPMPLGQWDTLGIAAQSFSLAFTDTFIADHYAGRVSNAELIAAGYVHFAGDAHWWQPSGTAVYPVDPENHFYIPSGARSPFGIETRVTFDAYRLLVERVEVVQAPWNVTTAVNDYRLLGPVLSTDANGNRAAVRVDTIGQVIATAVMGKDGDGDGDTLDDPTARMEYDAFNWMRNGEPNVVHTFGREQHGPANTRWVESYTYTSGSGGVAMVKQQAHPGRALQVDEDGTAVEVDADPRWIGNGRTILNNKGSVVKQYEPYFSVTHAYESERAVRELGVTPIAYYDALGRNVRTEYPDGTHSRVEFTPWLRRLFDAGDTVRDSDWYADRGSPDPALEAEPVNNQPRRAAWLTARRANTPGIVHFDSLGRSIYAITDYGGGVTATARVQQDLTGRFSATYDHLDREVATAFVAMHGGPVTSTSAEKGQRWIFPDVSGAVLKTWDASDRELRTQFDALRRPTGMLVSEPGQPDRVWQCVVYGDRLPNARQLNLLGIPHLTFDQSGEVRIPALNFKGLPARVERLLTRDYRDVVDWSAVLNENDVANVQAVADLDLDTSEVFAATGTYDALGRPIQVTLPDDTVVEPRYHVGGMLANLRARIRGQGPWIEFLRDQDYDATGKRQFAHLGNDLLTRYFYDPQTFRLVRLLTHGADSSAAAALQDLNFEFDAVGNVVYVRDDAQQTHYFNNAVVRPESLYEYDAVNQLIRATGRESAGGVNDDVRTDDDLPPLPQLPALNDDTAVRTYHEEYDYDLLGNITAMRHRYPDQAGAGGGWTRHYRYAYQANAADRTNRLTATSQPGDPDGGPYTGTYQYDGRGCMTRMPHLAQLDWNAMDQLQRVDLGGGGTAYYVYSASGERIRKVIDRDGTLQLEWIFLGGVMIFRRRRRTTGQLLFERRTVHIADNGGAIAQVDTKTVDVDGHDPGNAIDVPLIRYQYGNHLGSCGIETDADGEVVSYEEYHPFGTTSYRANRAGYDVSLKRFRYSGKECDDETGLYYFGARYYAPWLARWTSADPAGFVSGFNLFRYCSNNPVMSRDPNGMQDSLGVIKSRLDDPLRNPQREAEARAFLEREYTARLPDQTKVFRIDAMHYVRSTRSWLIDRAHLEDRPAEAPDAGEGEGAGGEGGGGDGGAGAGGAAEAAEGTDATTTSAAQTGGADSRVGEGGGMGATGRPTQQLIHENPTGFTLEVPDQFDDAKVDAMRERAIEDRGIGHRSRGANGSRTRDIRSWFQNLRDQFNNSLPANQRANRAAGRAIDHTVELQYIIRGNETAGADTVRPQDHRPQNASVNSSDGRTGRNVADAQIARGAPEDVPAGAVARSREINSWRFSENLRTGLRWGGYGLMAAGPLITAWGASQTDNPYVAGGAYASAVVEAGGTGAYFYGRFAMKGANAVQAGRAVMSVGGRVAMGAGGVGQFLLSGYMAVGDAQRGDWVAFAFDLAAALGGICLIAAAIVTSPAWATGLAIAGVVTGLAAGGYWLGRSLGFWGS